jgi:coatomer protein complex subunit alpha (xenin)
MALCNLQPVHRTLTLRSAMTLHYKQDNFIYACLFAKKLQRVIEGNPNAAKAGVFENA